MRLNNFLSPESIAILGASNDKSKVGRKILDNVLKNKNFKVFPINLKEKNIAGVKAYDDIKKLPLKNFASLLLVVAIPARFVADELEKAAKIGVKNVVIISAGFKEADLSGKRMEDRIIEIAQKNKMNILGPNCLGFINNKNNLNLSFSDFLVDKKIKRKDNIAFISQSGAIGSAVLDWLKNKNIGLSYFVSLGNKAILNENDFFDFFYLDKQTDLVVAYLEEISDGGRFLEIVSKIAKIKPIAILKAGRTSVGSQMAMSHTGSLAGSNEATLTALKRSGAIVLENISQIYNLMRIMKGPLEISSNNLAIVSNAGGPAVLSADEAFENNLVLDNFSKDIGLKLKKELPGFAHIKNPLDILGDADSNRYRKTLDLVLSDKKVESILVLLTLQSMTDAKNIAEVIVDLKNKYKNKLITTCFLGGVGVSEAKKVLADNLVSNFKNRKSLVSYENKPNKFPLDYKKEKIVVDYLDSFKFFKKYKIDIVETKKIGRENVDKIKYPIVIKFVGPDFIHKSDKGAVFLNIKNSSEVKKIIDRFNQDIKSEKISSDNYAVFQKMIKGDLELILGLKNDNVFGHIIMFGLGGIYTEIFKDINFELIDVDKKRITEMIKKIKSYPILKGARGKKGVDFNSLISLILKFVKMVRENPQISEIDLNPILISEGKAKITDVRIVL
jgi:acetyltransferase